MNVPLLPLFWVAILAAPTLPKPPAMNGENLVISAIRHRCVLECIFLDEHNESLPAADREKKKQECVGHCMDPKGVEAAMNQTVPKTWGATKEESIEVCLPVGEQYFLADLRCPDGKAPEFNRVGNVGPRNPMKPDAAFDAKMIDPSYVLPPRESDTHIIDKYEVTCSDKVRILFMDMYHCGFPKPWLPPAEFTRPPHG